MIRWALYIFPILVNYILGGAFFIVPLRCAQASAPGWVVGATLSAWAFVYAVSSFLIGKKTTPGNAVPLIVSAALLIALASAGFMVFPDVYLQFVWISLYGIGAAAYCTAFQIFAKSVEPDQNAGVIRATGLYTASWSAGLATGPFVFGLLTVRTSFIINLVIGLGIASGIYLLSRFAKKAPTSPDVPPAEVPPSPPQKPDKVMVGWVIGGTGTVAIFILRSLVPYRENLLGFSQAQAGIVIAAVSYVQALTGLFLIRGKTFMYKPLPAAAAGTCGIAALLIFGTGSTFLQFMAAAALFGIYSGFFYFMFVYHSLISPDKASRYVAVNEVIVGVTGTIGPFAAGLLTSPQTSGAAFPAAALVSAAGILFGIFSLRRTRV